MHISINILVYNDNSNAKLVTYYNHTLDYKVIN